MNEIYESLLLLRMPRVGPATYNDMVARFGSVAGAVEFLNPSVEHRDSVSREMDMAHAMNIEFILDADSRYPAALRVVKNHPPILSARGNVETLRCESVSIVGTRHATAVGMEFVADMANAFAAHGVCVTSGMAMGTDSAAHIGALRAAGNANTVAVLAGGVDYIWPIENERLYYQILERGVVVSDMPVGFIPKATNFVQRNRIVAAIGSKLILSEADLNSGSMKTVDFAEKIGRTIYAVPSHPADSRGAGPNSLIRSGRAILCQGASDFFVTDKKSDANEKKSESDNTILDKIGTVPLSESVLAEIVGKNISEIKRELVILELQGLIRKTDSGYVRV
ncbi:MAG: DNA-protecting protein DprA [Alphaproteobacteria bacterium]|nr:DNA-protecting protein DprA [Alphaproteobacteria bacterium]